jgi:hypothetical protein
MWVSKGLVTSQWINGGKVWKRPTFSYLSL